MAFRRDGQLLYRPFHRLGPVHGCVGSALQYKVWGSIPQTIAVPRSRTLSLKLKHSLVAMWHIHAAKWQLGTYVRLVCCRLLSSTCVVTRHNVSAPHSASRVYSNRSGVCVTGCATLGKVWTQWRALQLTECIATLSSK